MRESSDANSRNMYAAASLWHDKTEAWHEVLPGVRRRILARSLTGIIVLCRVAPGSVFPSHNHPHAQFGVFLEGGGTFRVGEETWTVKEGDSYFIPPGVYHELKTNPDRETVWIDFFTPDREDFINEALPPDN